MSRNSTNTTQIQKFCKVCQDSGKTEAEYRSHFTRDTRDPTSRVICPTLLALECRYCYKKGHTVKYCKVLKDKERVLSCPAPRSKENLKKADLKPKLKITNVFIVLDSDSEEEESLKVSKKSVALVSEPVVLRKDEYPALSAPSLARTQSVSVNYAAALAKPAAPKLVSTPDVKPAPWASDVAKPTGMKSWADYLSDTDDEDDTW